jgi:hypothetical protein
MADQDEIRLDCVGGDRRGRISIQKWIDNDLVSISLEPKRSVPVPGQFRGHENLLLVFPCEGRFSQSVLTPNLRKVVYDKYRQNHCKNQIL